MITPVILKNAESIYNQYSIKVKNRDGLKEVLRNRGIGHAVYYPIPLPYQACFSSLGLCFGDYPMAENAAAHSVSIPIFPELTRNEMDLVIESVLEAVTS